MKEDLRETQLLFDPFPAEVSVSDWTGGETSTWVPTALEVRDSGSITVHAPTGRRDGAPKRTPLGRYSRRRPQGIAADDGGRIYTSLPGDTVLIFAASASGHYKTAQVLAGPATGLKRPFGLAIDRRGNLYVANNAGSTITVYAPGSVGDASPIRTIEPVRARTMLQNPNFLAFDGHDTLYVGMPGGILVYSPKATGEVAPVRSIPTYYSIGIAVGRDRTLYVLSERNLLRVFGPGATDSTPLRTIHPAPPFRFSAFALGSRDRLYLTAYTDTAAIIYRTGARGTLPLARRFYGPSSMLSRPIGIAVDRQDQVYVANGPQPMPHGAIRVYGATATGDTLPDRLIAGQATQLSQPTDIAVNTRGEMYAVNTNWRSAGWITVHSSGADGNAAPIRTISGPNTLLRQPIKLAIGTGDTVFVLNAFNLGKYGTANVTVTVYGPKAAGNIDPVRTITVTGGQTVRGGRFPTGIAVDARGSVYLSDYGSNFVSVYGPGAKGAVLPARRIRLRPAEDANGRAWTYMGGAAIAIGPRNELFVAAFPQQMVFTRREVRPNGKASDPEVAPLSLTLGGAYSR